MAAEAQSGHKSNKPPAVKPRRRLTEAEEDAILGRLIQESREEAEREGYASIDEVWAILRKGAKQASDGA